MHRAIAVASLLATLACTKSPTTAAPQPRSPDEAPVANKEDPAPSEDLPPEEDLYYGVYLNGHKVGWMRSRTQVGDSVTLTTQLEAAVGGMGKVSRITLNEIRKYDAATKALQSIHFSQEAATGSVEVKGVADNGTLKIATTAGKATQESSVPVTEDLDDALAAWKLVKAGKVGESVTASRYDASIQKTVKATYTLEGEERKNFAGVDIQVFRMKTVYVSLGITESGWVDQSGKLLETQVGGFFVARLEPPDVAKKLDYSHDILISAVVSTPEKIQNAEDLDKVEVTFTGFGENPPPGSPRQKVQVKGDKVTVSMLKDPQPSPVALADARKLAGKEATELLEATAFVQSESPEVVAAAQRVVGDATDVFEATTRLTRFVFEHVRDEYVPAYSNALEALESGRGDCTEHSILFVALARALGIPARVAVGIAYWPPGDGFGWHAWAEVKAGDTWYSVDPTWNQPIADATHLKLADGGPAEQARIVMLLGQLKVVDLVM